MLHLPSRLCLCGIVLTAPLLLTGCGLVSGLLNTALGLVGPATQAKIMYRCVPEGVNVDTPSGPLAIEELHPGDVVLGYSGQPVRILQKHEYLESDAAKRFLRICFADGAEVRVCDMHRVGGTRASDLRPGSEIGGNRIQSIHRFGAVSHSYDLLTEDDGYQIDGIPVNSIIEELNGEIQRNVARNNVWRGRAR